MNTVSTGLASGGTAVPGKTNAIPHKRGLIRQLRFAFRSLLRDLRSGELRVLALALLVAVASVTAVGFFTDRIGRAVEQQAGDVLAADLVASAGYTLPDSLVAAVQDSTLQTAQHVRFPSVVINERDESQLTRQCVGRCSATIRTRLATR